MSSFLCADGALSIWQLPGIEVEQRHQKILMCQKPTFSWEQSVRQLCYPYCRYNTNIRLLVLFRIEQEMYTKEVNTNAHLKYSNSPIAQLNQ